MPLGYKYVERQADSYTNWAEIGKNMSDMITETDRVREEKKAAIDQASRDFQEKLLNIPTGQDENAKKAALEFADNASKYMRMQDKLLKSGKMKLKDYTIARQNLLDGTDQAFGAVADYQKKYGEKMDRYKEGKSSLGEVKNMAKAEGYGNWNQSGFYINPANGQVVMALKEKKNVDGKDIYTMSENPNDISSVAHVKGLIEGQWDKYDVQGAATQWAKGLGKYIQADSKAGTLLRGGEIRSVEDITKRTDIDEGTKKVLYNFFNAETGYIDAALENPFNRASVLLDQLGTASNGKEYRFTQDENDAKNNPEAILEVINPSTQAQSFKFNKEQMEASTEFVRGQARSQYNIEEKITPTAQAQLQEKRAPTGPELSRIQQAAAAKVWGKNLANFITGNNDKVQAAGKFFAANSIKLDKTADGYTYTDPKGEVVKFPYGTDPKVIMNGLVGALNSSQLPEDLLVTEASKNLGKTVNTKDVASGFEISTKPAKVTTNRDYMKEFSNIVKNIPTDVFGKSQGIVVSKLKDNLSKLNITITPTGAVGSEVTFSSPGKPSVSIESYRFGEKNSAESLNKLNDWLSANFGTEEKIKEAMDIAAPAEDQAP